MGKKTSLWKNILKNSAIFSLFLTTLFFALELTFFGHFMNLIDFLKNILSWYLFVFTYYFIVLFIAFRLSYIDKKWSKIALIILLVLFLILFNLTFSGLTSIFNLIFIYFYYKIIKDSKKLHLFKNKFFMNIFVLILLVLIVSVTIYIIQPTGKLDCGSWNAWSGPWTDCDCIGIKMRMSDIPSGLISGGMYDSGGHYCYGIIKERYCILPMTDEKVECE